MLNVYEQVDRNKRKSALIIFLFILFITLTGAIISKALDWGWGGLILSLFFSSFGSLIAYYSGDRLILSLNQAHPVNKSEEPLLYSVVENLSLAAQIPVPKVYVSETAAANAFACGRDPKHASICVTRGLLKLLDKRTELEGVIGHEISHIKNFDTRLFLIVSVLIGGLNILARFFLRSPSRKKKDDASETLFLLGFILSILSPLIGELIKLAISRQREFLADAGSAMLTRQPRGLINALIKISQPSQMLPQAQAIPAFSHFYIINPFSSSSSFARLFNTHPPVEERINELKKML